MQTFKIMRALCRRNPESREDRIPQASTFGDTIYSRSVIRAETRLHKRRWEVCCDLQKGSLEWIIHWSSQKLANIGRGIAEDLWRNRDKSTRPTRNQMESPTERSARRVVEGTSTLSVQSGKVERWRRTSDGMRLFTKHSRIFSRWENTSGKKIRHSTPWSNNTLCSRDFFIIQFPQKTRTGFINSAQKTSQVFLLDKP